MAEGASVFNAELKAVDGVSGPLKRILGSMQSLGSVAAAIGQQGRGMAAVLSAAFGKVETSAKSAASGAKKAGHEIEAAGRPHNWIALAGHVKLLRGHFGALNASVGQLRGSLTGMVPLLAGLGGMGSVAGAFGMVDKVSGRTAEFQKNAKSVGLSPKELGGMTYAAKMSDVPVEAMTSGLGKLNVAMGNAVNGKNKNVAALFKKLGISLKDAQGHVLTTAQAMPKLADAFQRTQDPAIRAAMAQALFGKGGREMLPLLMQGGAAFEEYTRKAAEVRYPFTGEEAHNLEEYHKSMLTLGEAVTGFTNAIGAKLAPVLRPIIDQFTKWIVANRDWIATGIAGAVSSLAASLSGINLEGKIEGFAHLVGWVGTLGGLISPVTGGFGALGAVLLGPAISGVTMIVGGISRLAKIMRVVTALALANPWTAAFVGLAAVAIAIYENWDRIKALFGRLSAWFNGQPAIVQGLVVAFAPFMGIPLLIIEHWGKIKQFFADLWGGIIALFDNAMQHVTPIINTIKGAVGVAKSIGGAVSNAFASAPQVDEFGRPVGNSDGPGPIPPTYREGSPVAPAAPAAQDGQVKVAVEFKNAPPGTQVQAASSGAAAHPDVDVGYSRAGLAGAF